MTMLFLRACRFVTLTFSTLALAGAVGFLACLLPLIPQAASAQAASCAGQSETQLREKALASNDPELTKRYLGCFPYGDGANSVRSQDKKLQEAAACRQAMSSNSADELRSFIGQWSQSECAPQVASRLSQLNDVSAYTRYPNSIFNGSAASQNQSESERACASSCKAAGNACSGYSFESGAKTCTMWSRIDSRMPRGNMVSGSLAPVRLGVPTAQQPQPQTLPVQPTESATPSGQMRYIQGMDIPDGDYMNLRDITIDQCDLLCKQQDACAAFTYNTRANACFLKNRLSGPVPFVSAISGFKASETSMNTPSRPMQILDGTDLPNSNPSDDYALLRQTTYNACRSSCEGDRQCAAFTYNHTAQACILKRAYGRRLVFTGATSGIK